MKKRILSLLLALALCVGLAPVSTAVIRPSEPEPDVWPGGFLVQYGHTLVGYEGEGGDIVIPDGITELKYSALSNNDAITGVTIPNGVTEIPAQAFNLCRNLTWVSIPDSVVSIGNVAFAYTNLTSVVLPDSVETLGAQVFWNCDALTSVTFGQGLTAIGLSCFSGTGLTEVVIPDTVTSIGDRAFARCDNLTSVYIPSSVTSIHRNAFAQGVTADSYSPYNDDLIIYCEAGSAAAEFAQEYATPVFGTFDEDGTFTPDPEPEPTPTPKPAGGGSGGGGGSTTQIGSIPTPMPTQSDFVIDEQGVLTRYQGTATDVVIPNGVREIAADTFSGSSITSLVMPDSVTKIGDNAFRYCFHLSTITLSKNLTEVGNNIFRNDDELTNVINSDVLGDKRDIVLATHCDIVDGTLLHFDSGGHKEMIVPNGVTRIAPPENSYFYTGDGISRVVLPDTLKVIEGTPFRNNNRLEEVEFGEGLTTIGADAFSGCQKLKSINLPASITSIGSRAFSGCFSLADVSIANPDVKIADDAFARCHLLKYYYLNGEKIKVYILAKEQAAEAKEHWAERIPFGPGSETYQAELKINQDFIEKYITPSDYIYTIVTSDVRRASDAACEDWSTDKEKVFAIHEWITENIYYDYACLSDGTLHMWTAQEAVETRKAVCNGYAVLFQAMCWAQGIPCVYVTGDTTAGYHAWNAVLVDGEWRWVDCTWDTYNEYHGENSWHKGATRMYYFLCPSEFITTDHVVRHYTDYLTGEERPTAFVVDGINAYLPQQTQEEKEAIIEREQTLQEESLKKQQMAEELKQDDSLSEWALTELQSAMRTGLVPDQIKRNYSKSITREEFCVLMVHLLGQHSGKDMDAYLSERGLKRTDPFVDTDNADVLAAYALGIVKGTGETTFNPDGQITRQEAATMLARTAKVLGMEAGGSVDFADAETFADWSREGIAFVSGIVDPYNGKRVMEGTGEGTFSPGMTYSREQAIITALRLYSASGKQTIRKGVSGE